MKKREDAKAESKAGSLSVAFLFLAVASIFIFLIVDAIHNAKSKPSLEQINSKRAIMASLPSVNGHLQEIEIISFSYSRTREPSGTDFWPEVKYSYEVGERLYHGKVIRPELSTCDHDVYFCNDPLSGLQAAKSKLSAFLPANLPEHKKKIDSAHNSYSYFTNSTVPVYYDPKNPQFSMLDHNWQALSWWDYYSEDIFEGMTGAFLASILIAAALLVLIASSSVRKSPGISKSVKRGP
ncbi:MAG: DUF3592 domain-containing protein [Candidatus Obscuribacterales bacterium]|nr:DUF3592 domain-containing protein [Candidatus Obscuribacterales bacterium]